MTSSPEHSTPLDDPHVSRVFYELCLGLEDEQSLARLLEVSEDRIQRAKQELKQIEFFEHRQGEVSVRWERVAEVFLREASVLLGKALEWKRRVDPESDVESTSTEEFWRDLVTNEAFTRFLQEYYTAIASNLREVGYAVAVPLTQSFRDFELSLLKTAMDLSNPQRDLRGDKEELRKHLVEWKEEITAYEPLTQFAFEEGIRRIGVYGETHSYI